MDEKKEPIEQPQEEPVIEEKPHYVPRPPVAAGAGLDLADSHGDRRGGVLLLDCPPVLI